MSGPRGWRWCVPLSLVVSLLVAAPLKAAEVAVGARCVAEGDTIDVRGSGFMAGAPVWLALSRGNAPLHLTIDPLADGDGRVAGSLALEADTGWFRRRETRFDMTLSLRDQLGAAAYARTTFPFSRWSVMVGGVPRGTIHARRPARLHAAGWTRDVGRSLFAHYVLRGRRRHTERLGVLRGPCGDVRRTLPRGFPFGPVAPGRWTVVFSTRRDDHRGGRAIRLAAGTIGRRLA